MLIVKSPMSTVNGKCEKGRRRENGKAPDHEPLSSFIRRIAA